MLEVKGTGGQLRIAGRLAATLGDWTLERREGIWDILAHVNQRDAYWMAQGGASASRPLGAFKLVLPMGRWGTYTWDGAEIRGAEGNPVQIVCAGAPMVVKDKQNKIGRIVRDSPQEGKK